MIAGPILPKSALDVYASTIDALGNITNAVYQDNPQQGADIIRVSDGSTIGKVLSVTYDNVICQQCEGTFSSTAKVITQSNITVTPGEALQFKCGRHQISITNGHNVVYTGNMHYNSQQWATLQPTSSGGIPSDAYITAQGWLTNLDVCHGYSNCEQNWEFDSQSGNFPFFFWTATPIQTGESYPCWNYNCS